MTQLVNNFFEVSPVDIEKVAKEQSMAQNIEALRQTIELANQHGDYDRQADRQPFTVLSIEEAFADTEGTMLGGRQTISHSVCATAISAVLKLALDNGLPMVAKKVIAVAEDRYLGLQGGGEEAVELNAELERHKERIIALTIEQTNPPATNELNLSKFGLN